ncbi:MAG: pyridoxal phosphate-dependent aminotransferase family protein, partial [candidate division Zixibacteria bacterium]|nr:pyridoxal phosphate-dependent aminotransferase family protein [candidate division Zixibacteria bacterium]
MKTDLFEKCRNFTRADEVKAAGLYPYFQPISSAPGNEVTINNKKMIMIGSNNYLGMTDDPRVKEAAADAARKYGSGCTGSRYLNGTLDIHVELEERLAKFSQKESALVFSTGFQSNLGAISCIVGKNDVAVIDRANHASIVEACRLAYGKTYKFAHNNIDDLDRVLGNLEKNGFKGGILVIVDGVFSMEGDIINLPRLVEVANKYGARIMVDDAHAVGVLGKGGRGTGEHFDMIDKIDIQMGTFSKSFASIGGFIAGSSNTINFIKHHSRELIFSASLPPSSTAVVLKVLDIIESEPERIQNLWKNAKKMQTEFRRLGFDIGATQTPIVPVMVGEDMKCFAFWKELFENGIFTNPVISPAVPPDQALLRTSYTATHTDEHLDRVLDVFEKIG